MALPLNSNKHNFCCNLVVGEKGQRLSHEIVDSKKLCRENRCVATSVEQREVPLVLRLVQHLNMLFEWKLGECPLNVQVVKEILMSVDG